MAHSLRPAGPRDVEPITALLPQLADFDVPAGRDPRYLWASDLETLLAWRDGRAPGCLVHVAERADGEILGFTIVTLRDELLSHAPSSHLEAIAVAEPARGLGIGAELLANAEAAAARAGATSMTLHVFAANERARGLYRKAGYSEELIRDFKRLQR